MSTDQSHLTLNTNQKIPQLGLGTWQISPDSVDNAIETAFELGYRHFDCATVYGNEPEIGRAFAKLFSTGKAKREEIFVTSKIWNTYHSHKSALENVDKILQDLRLHYVDMGLIHWPMGYKEGGEFFPEDAEGKKYSNVDYLETWKALEDAVQAGKVKSIGLSNFNKSQIQRVIDNGKIKPSNLQIESHPYFSQYETINWCKERGIVVTCYGPLSSPANIFRQPGDPSIFEEPLLKSLGHKHGKTVSQVVLRWHIQRGVVVIPKSVTRSHLAENLQIWDFKLSEEDMKSIDGMNKNFRLVKLSRDISHPFYPFHEA